MDLVFLFLLLLASCLVTLSLILTPPSLGFLLVLTDSFALTTLVVRLRLTLFGGYVVLMCMLLGVVTVISVADYPVVNCKWVCIVSSFLSSL
jgi:hypothetical protein